MNKLHDSVVNDLQNLLTLVGYERDEEYAWYNETLAKLTVQEKTKQGFSWYPGIVKETGFGLGDYPFLVIENTKGLSPVNFNPGNPVKVYNSNDASEFVNGTIQYVDGHYMKILFLCDELPDWMDNARIAVDAVFDNKTFKAMTDALNSVIQSKEDRVVELANILQGEATSGRNKKIIVDTIDTLNEAQNQAVKLILQTSDIALVHGPPGTGKTTTIIQAIKQLVNNGEQVLVCTPSNASADHIGLGMSRAGIKVLRLGNLSRINEDLYKLTLEGCLDNHARNDELLEFKRRAVEYRRMAGKYKRKFGPEERQQRDLLYKEARSLSKESRELESYMVGEIIRNSQVIVTTMVGSTSHYLEGMRFNYLFIDEAAQALEPACWIPILKAEKVIMAGDPFQLPPTVKSNKALKGGFNRTLMEKAMARNPANSVLLNKQYRMNDLIMAFSNRYFYKDQLVSDESVANRTVNAADGLDAVVEFIDMAGCGFEEERDSESQSLFNSGEITVIKSHMKHLESNLLNHPEMEVAVISPYRAQADRIKAILQAPKPGYKVAVNTVDSFQGQEKDVVYISLVRSNPNQEIGFLKDYRRMNVAMTRAKMKLVIVGDSSTMGVDDFYGQLLEFIEHNCHYKTGWEYIFRED